MTVNTKATELLMANALILWC